jgi:hypothetical protein
MNPEFSLRRMIQTGAGLGALSTAAFLAERGDPNDQLSILVSGIGGLGLMVHAAFGNVKQQMVHRKPPADKLDRVLLRWDEENVFTLRDILSGGVAIFGRTGSGKSSSSGKAVARALVGLPGSGGLIIAAKPGEDRAMWEDIFTKAGRRDDLLIFAPDQPLRFNFLAYEMNQGGGHARNVCKTLMTIGESLRSSDKSGREDSDFWEREQERLLFNAIEMVKLAQGPFTAPELQKFIATAAMSPEDFHRESWLEGFHNQALRAAYESPKTPIEQHDYELARTYFESEWPEMASRTRSSILTGVMGILHVFNTGLVRELVSTTTNVMPDDLFAGRWVLLDMAASEWSDIGRFVAGGWKYLVQRAVLRRVAGPDANPVILFLDEAQGAVTSFDAHYLAQCRSHLGSAVYLSQSLPGYYAGLGGDKGKHSVDALLAGFSTKVFHALGDVETAQWASGLVGKSLQRFSGGSMTPPDSPFGELMGESRYSGNFNQSYESTLQANEFMHGLRTGGAENGFTCDCFVVRSGVPFANGLNWIRTSFDQRS